MDAERNAPGPYDDRVPQAVGLLCREAPVHCAPHPCTLRFRKRDIMNLQRLLTPMRRPIPLSREGFGWFVLSAAMLSTGLIKSINLITLFACLLIAAGMVNFVLARRQVAGLH